MTTKKEIVSALRPLSEALLKRGEVHPQVSAFGYTIYGIREYASPGQTGPAWNPRYYIKELKGSFYGGARRRDELVDFLHKVLSGALKMETPDAIRAAAMTQRAVSSPKLNGRI